MRKTSSRLAASALATAAALAAPAAWSADAQIAVRDAATGALRAATPAEIATLQNSGRSGSALRVAPETTLSKYHATGARGVRLTSEFMSYSVVTRRADGTLAEACVNGAAEAEALVKAGATTKPAARLETE